MITLFALWLPILLSAVAVFVVSSILHMVFKYHQSDFKQVPDEARFMETVGGFNLAPGNYHFPWAQDMKEAGSPEFVARYTKGPVGLLTVIAPGPPTMVPQLVQWFIYSLVVGVFVAYIGRLSLPAGSEYLTVSRVTGATAFCGYGLALLQNAIWFKKGWSATLKSVFDGLIYGLVTGGFFGWLWPTV